MTYTHFYNARRLEQSSSETEFWVRNGRFVEPPADTGAVESINLGGELVLPGLVETHIHLDKSCIMERCRLRQGTLAEAIEQTAAAKRDFSEEDIYRRAQSVIEKAIVQGTSHMRTHVELDPVIGLKGLRAIQRLQRDYAWAVSLELCVFPQEGMLNNPGTEGLLITALKSGAEVLGGCPYTDSEPELQIRRLFEIAVEHDRDLDFHLDFNLDPDSSLLPLVIAQTLEYGWQRRVTVGHVTSLSAMPLKQLEQTANHLAEAGVSVTALPSTDLFLNGRNSEFNIPRGVAPLQRLEERGVCCSLSTNNLGNPFTPFGDASLIRQANLYANIAQLGTGEGLIKCLNWVSRNSAQLLRLEGYGLEVGCWADFITVPACGADQVISELIAPSCGYKRGRKVFQRSSAELLAPLVESGERSSGVLVVENRS
ncbi:amidohydrolase family protein [Aestuariirhabdus sp. LZHN29]|uniref:amidohydrolase family protein n=1 Tax=Aestuariirhabdus sp. LZHN29 TaxID=3417462 RepID=UPI003CFAECF5